MPYDKKIRNMDLEKAKQEVQRADERMERYENAYDDGVAAIQGHIRKIDDENEQQS